MAEKERWVVGFMMIRDERGGTDDRLCGYLPVFETEEAALRWANGKATVFAVQDDAPEEMKQ